MHNDVLCVQVFGLERVAITVPADAMGHFHQAVGLCLREALAGNLPSSSEDLLGSSANLASGSGTLQRSSGIGPPLPRPASLNLLGSSPGDLSTGLQLPWPQPQQQPQPPVLRLSGSSQHLQSSQQLSGASSQPIWEPVLGPQLGGPQFGSPQLGFAGSSQLHIQQWAQQQQQQPQQPQQRQSGRTSVRVPRQGALGSLHRSSSEGQGGP